jgi:hypothetical protein
MSLIQEEDVAQLLQQTELMTEIARAVVETPGVMEKLADEIAEELDEQMEDAPEFRKLIVDAAVASPKFGKLLAAKLFDEDDD